MQLIPTDLEIRLRIHGFSLWSQFVKPPRPEPGHPLAWERPDHFANQQERMSAKQAAGDNDIPPVIVLSLRKSGSSLVTAILHTGLDLPWCCVAHRYRRIDPSWLAWLAQGRCVTHDHLVPTPRNISRVLTSFPNIAVHIRDPRAAAVSLAHHNTGKITPDQVEHVYFGHIAPWLDGWLAAAEDFPQRIKLFRYEDLLADPLTYFHSLTEWLGIPDRHFSRIERAISQQMNNRRTNNFRRGDADGWRDEIPTDLTEKLWAHTPLRVRAFFDAR